jgi:hypothetical protein
MTLFADDQDCLWTTGPNYNSSCLSPSTPLLQAAGYGMTIPRNYTQPDASTSPLSFLIRVSDNLDSMKNRLTAEQASEDFMEYLCWLYTDEELRMQNNNASAQPAARIRALQAATHLDARSVIRINILTLIQLELFCNDGRD